MGATEEMPIKIKTILRTISHWGRMTKSWVRFLHYIFNTKNYLFTDLNELMKYTVPNRFHKKLR